MLTMPHFNSDRSRLLHASNLAAIALTTADHSDVMKWLLSFMKWRKAVQFDPKKASAVTWVFTIARNRRIDRLRKEKRPALDPNDPILLPNDSPTPLQNMEQSTIVESVKRSIGDLPEDQREVVRLSFIEGLSHQEISDAIGIPPGTVKSRLRLSFEKLRHTLGDFQ
jgi:RNA polymerase sigma-70 factor (ECF subfamily)